MIELNDASFQRQCPTFRNLQSKPATLVGFPATISTDNCSDPKSPAVGETTAALTPDHLLLSITVISPLSRYYDVLPDIDLLRNTFRLVNHPYTPRTPEESDAHADLRRACLAGVFTQEDCALRIGSLLGKEDRTPTPSTTANIYRDATGRFSVEVPTGWKAIAEGDNGIDGVQLRSGSSWINLMPADAATTASKMVLNYEQQIVTRSNSNRTPPLGSIGLIQIFGHNLEITYDNFSGSSPQGDPVDTYIAGIGDISGTGPQLLLVASLANSPPEHHPSPSSPSPRASTSVPTH